MHSRTEELFPAAVEEWQQHFAAILQVGLDLTRQWCLLPVSAVQSDSPILSGSCSRFWSRNTRAPSHFTLRFRIDLCSAVLCVNVGQCSQ